MDHIASDHEFVETGRRGCGPGCQLIVASCACGLERRLRVIDGTVRNVEVKPPGGWQWHDVVDLLRVNLPYALCPRCAGSGCESCRQLGIMEVIKPRTPTGAGRSS
jgi:hypothetical protein